MISFENRERFDLKERNPISMAIWKLKGGKKRSLEKIDDYIEIERRMVKFCEEGNFLEDSKRDHQRKVVSLEKLREEVKKL